MRNITTIFILLNCIFSYCQSLNLNQSHIEDYFRTQQLLGNLDSKKSFTIKPFSYSTDNQEKLSFKVADLNKSIVKKNKFKIELLPIDLSAEYNSLHPYNRNNGSLIPNRGFQQLVSLGFFSKIGPLEITIKPEYHYAQNLDYAGFWDGHYDQIWAKRYDLWNRVDIPERFGEKSHSRFLLGQSSINLKFNNFTVGISNENIWWGPSIRNSIMMSNQAEGFKHISIKTVEPINTPVGQFEFQVITGRLERSGYTPPDTSRENQGSKLYIPKINQIGHEDDWRYLQAYIINYQPKWVDGLSIGMIRWVQMYSALLEGKYTWMIGKPTYFPVFSNLFRKNDSFENYEAQTDQAAGIFLRWLWQESNMEIYSEFHYNDAKQNIRDLLLDSDHSRAVTLGIQKIFKINQSNFLFNWEWTQMEQNASRLIRPSGSWYLHGYVVHGYTNKGEVLGSGIGPGSNSQYFSLNFINDFEKFGLGFEIVDHDNDFFHDAFSSAKDHRRYWKDFNLHLVFNKKFKNFWLSSNLVYVRSLNYQWELNDFIQPYYHAGKDTNNFHLNFKLSYLIPKN